MRRVLTVLLVGGLWSAALLDVLEPGWGRFYNPLPRLPTVSACPKANQLVAAPGLAAFMPFVMQQLRVGSPTAAEDALSRWQGLLGEPLCSRQEQGNTLMTWALPFPDSYLQLTFTPEDTVIKYGILRRQNANHSKTTSGGRAES